MDDPPIPPPRFPDPTLPTQTSWARATSTTTLVRNYAFLDVRTLQAQLQRQYGIRVTAQQVKEAKEGLVRQPRTKQTGGRKRKVGEMEGVEVDADAEDVGTEAEHGSAQAGPSRMGKKALPLVVKKERVEKPENQILMHTLTVDCIWVDPATAGLAIPPHPWMPPDDLTPAYLRKTYKSVIEILRSRVPEGQAVELAAGSRLQQGSILIEEGGVIVNLDGMKESDKGFTHLADAGLEPMARGRGARVEHWVTRLNSLVNDRSSRCELFSVECRAFLSWHNTPTKGGHSQAVEPTLVVKAVLEVYLDRNKINQRYDHNISEDVRYILHALHPIPGYIQPPLPDGGVFRYHPPYVSVQDFFQHLRPAPLTSLRIMNKMQPLRLAADLFPFQKRSLAFLLAREDATHLDPDLHEAEAGDPPGFWEKIAIGDLEAGGVEMNFCRITGTLRELETDQRRDKGKGRAVDYEDDDGDVDMDYAEAEDERQWEVVKNGLFNLKQIRGGLLCEEMGLGKTMISIALILSNPAVISEAEAEPMWDPDQLLHTQKIKATLIVTPESLFKQWHNELESHAPGLVVESYGGWKTLFEQVQPARPKKPVRKKAPKSRAKARKRAAKKSIYKEDSDDYSEEQADEEEEESEEEPEDPSVTLIKRLSKADVVLCTFDTLGRDWAFAAPPPTRRTRGKTENARKARPRSGLLLFHFHRIFMDEVQLVPLSSTTAKPTEMMRLIKRTHAHAISGTPAKTSLDDLIGVVRYLGLDVSAKFWKLLQYSMFSHAFYSLFARLAVRTTKAQLNGADIPSQRRILVALDLSPVERRYNADLLERSFTALKLSPDGFPTTFAHTDGVLLRKVIHELRQTATHIQVGALNAANVVGGRRLQLTSQKRRNRILTMAEALVRMKLQGRRDTWDLSREEVLLSIRRAWLLGMQTRPNKAPKQTETILLRVFNEVNNSIRDMKALLLAKEASVVESEDSEELEDQHDPQVAYRLRIRDLSELAHSISFALGNYYFNFGPEAKESEDRFYDEANNIRKQLLKAPAQKADRSIVKVKAALTASGIDDFDMLEIEETGKLGVMSDRLGADANETIDILGDNAEIIWNWRGEIVKSLTTPLEQEGDEATGEEYTGTMEGQHKLEAYMAAYAASINDRIEIMSQQRTVLAAHDSRPKKKRSTKTALEAIRNAAVYQPFQIALDPVDEDVIQDAELLAELMEKRQAIKQRHSDHGRPLKAIIIDLNDVINRTTRPEEIQLAQGEVKRLRAVTKQQTEYVHKLTVELKTFQDSFNARVEFFRSLQMLSDAVAEPELGAKPIPEQLNAIVAEIQAKEQAIALSTARSRYLESINDPAAVVAAEEDEEAETCILCFSEFDNKAVLLSCGHRFCLECFTAYRATQGGGRCLLCRAPIHAGDIQKVTMKAVEPEPTPVAANGSAYASKSVEGEGPLPMPKLDDTYFSMIGRKEEQMIHEREIMGDWGTKIDFLIKHIAVRSDVKHIVFSSWGDALAIVKEALFQNGIPWVSLEALKLKKGLDPVKEFADDENIKVFLLHGERESSGLTLTTASVVHMLEPVLNHGFELQAIGRVDRLGQKNNTEVYCYAMRDTIEAKILHNHINQGTCIYGKGNDGLINAAVTAVAKRGGDDLSGSTEELLDLIL